MTKTKNVKDLRLGDMVLSLTNTDGTLRVFTSPLIVVQTGAFLKLSNVDKPSERLAFWPTGKSDTRTCVTI